MGFKKLIKKIKFPAVPSIFSNRNVFRKYKLFLFKGKEEGKIVFFEKVRKDFVMMSFLKVIKKLNKSVPANVSAPKTFRATSKELAKFPGTNTFINKKMEQYVNQIKNVWKKKHPNWSLWRHEFSFIEFEEVGTEYNVTFELEIWVSGLDI